MVKAYAQHVAFASLILKPSRRVGESKEPEKDKEGAKDLAKKPISHEIKDAVENTVSANQLPVRLKSVGCVGMCHQVPLVEIVKTESAPVLYSKVDAASVKSIVEKHFNPPSLGKRLKKKILQYRRFHTVRFRVGRYLALPS